MTSRSSSKIIQKQWEKYQYTKLRRSPDELDQRVTEIFHFRVVTKKGCCAYTRFWRQTPPQDIKFNRTDTVYIFPLNKNLSLLTKER